jgi:TolB-like protein/DNA-binding winged helix-turn-helix (wHTH) protein/Flp pilus assembly protein TadD
VLPLSSQQRLLHFGDFDVDLDSGELRKHGTRIKLQVQPFQVLQVLLERPREVVSREEFQKRIWPAGTFVDFDQGLNNAVKKLREALADDAEKPRFIETLSKRGYRFIGAVHNGAVATAPKELIASATNVGTNAPEIRRKGFARGLVLGAVVVVALILVLGLNPAGMRDRLFGKSTAPRIQSLAVLPLQNLSTDPAQEYFSDGMTDALITDLAQMGSVKVISRTSIMRYKKTDKSLPDIARELGVDGIIEGTVQRSGDHVRITAQLIESRSDKHLWANSYERNIGDVLALERDVTDDIAHEVQRKIIKPVRSALPQPPAINPEALEAYLQGTYHLNGYGRGSGEEELRRASEYFQQAIDIDHSFVLAYIGMAKAHDDLPISLPEDRAIRKKAAEAALGLDPKSSDALGLLAELKWHDFDWSGAEQGYRQSISFNPNNARVRDEFCTLLAEMGRMEEASRECQIAQELDPENAHLPFLFYWRGESDRAIAMLRMVIDRHPDDGGMHYLLFQSYAQQGDQKDAIEQAEKTLTLYGYSEAAAKLEHAFTTSGYKGALRTLVKDFERLHASKQTFIPVNLADLYATLGDKDRAFYWLEQAYAHHDMISAGEPLDYIMVNPMIDPLRSDPRFKDLVRRIGLPP